MFFHECKLELVQDRSPSRPELAAKLTELLEMQQGFQSCYVGHDGDKWRLVSIWRSEAHYLSYLSGDEGSAAAALLAAEGFVTSESSQMTDIEIIEPRVEELRLIQATVVPSEIEGVMEYWRTTGRELNESADGCVRAQAFIDEEESQLHFAIWWRTAAEASHFRYTDHLDGELARGFGNGFRSFGRYSLAPVKL